MFGDISNDTCVSKGGLILWMDLDLKVDLVILHSVVADYAAFRVILFFFFSFS